MTLKYYPNFATIKDGDDGVIVATASTGAIDRDGEIIVPGAFAKSLDRFVNDGAILACHQHRLPDGSPPMIGRPIYAKYTDQGALEVGFKLGTSELAQKWAAAKADGTWRGVSVGFMPTDGEYKSVEGRNVYHHKEAELFELSGVPVGSNRDALLKGMGLVDTNIFAELKAEGIPDITKLLASVKTDIIAEVKATIEGLLVPDADEYAELLMRNAEKGHENEQADEDACVLARVLASKTSLTSK